MKLWKKRKVYCCNCISFDMDFCCCRERELKKVEGTSVYPPQIFLTDTGKRNPFIKNAANDCKEYKRKRGGKHVS